MPKGPLRAGIAGLAAAALMLLAVAAFSRALAPITTDADFALTELYTELATRGELLLGPYSRFGWHHPGPLYFYVQAPFYAAGGHKAAALFAGALAINLSALATIAWVMWRERRDARLVLITVACVLLAWRVPRLLASPWTGHVPLLPALAFIVLCAAIANGRRRLIPLAIVTGSFVAQTHLSLAPAVALLMGCVLVSLARGRRAGDPALGTTLNRAAWVGLALWLLPLSEALSHAGGNIAALWRFFITDAAAGQPLWKAVVHWSYGLTGVLRPDLTLPWGGHIALDHSAWTLPAALAQLVLLALIARRDLQAGRGFSGRLALFLCL
ncbi:MAG: hypothetical protein M3R55_01345, partial [Acidobacteriota bacterium]|nr:hypothetical protein [Acidobacteriota bacterium]